MTDPVTTSESQLEQLDELDLELLCLLDAEPLWKTKAYDRLGKRSVQTIGRRITQLQERGLVKTHILSPDDIDRDLIIAYTPTDAGDTLLDQEICQTCHVPRTALDHEHRFDSVRNCFSR
ncbi:hypothetical protein [Halorarum salinum]|uniref:Uncharacterized protein n=1 Tax=Halorarum salinum TaxID=2743089 RepID=A0A7D5LAC3_9EURY|nr:hypothetical protein [Halobaculum salinum]QLG61953.1 hypothetical protein HUG12_09570 [Halobaculum salinum]